MALLCGEGGKQEKARSTDETGTRGRRREAGETTGLSSGRYVTLFTVFTTTYVSLLYSC